MVYFTKIIFSATTNVRLHSFLALFSGGCLCNRTCSTLTMMVDLVWVFQAQCSGVLVHFPLSGKVLMYKFLYGTWLIDQLGFIIISLQSH